MYFETLIGKFCLKGALNSNIQLSYKFSCVNLLKPEFKGPMWKQSFLFLFQNGDYHMKKNILALKSRKTI